MEFIKLFSPITINKLKIKNRIVMPSMGLAFTDSYTFNDRYKAFYRERAKGGVGLMTMGPMAIDRVGSAPFMPSLFDDKNVEPIKEFIEELRGISDVKIATQLFQMGRYAFSYFSGMTPIGPSAVPSKFTGETPREMTKDDIEEVKASFASAALMAKDAGFDYVEIIACGGYLINQFLSPLTNKRKDEYGGPIENRMRFGLEVISKVREALGEDFPLGIRVAGNDFVKGSHTNIESAIFCEEADKAGINGINVTGGWHETKVPQIITSVPPGAYTYLARGIKQKVKNAAVFSSNRLGDPYLAEKTLRAGSADMICWGRPLICDPYLPNKVKEGRLSEIVPCIACNQGCFDSLFSGTPVSCILNPRAGMEDEIVVEKANVKKKVFVAGGGPAGMEFAIVSAERGHDVTLYEKGDQLGGQLNLAKVPPGKKDLQRIIDSMRGRMENAGVDIRLETLLSPEIIKSEKPDVVVMASGAKPIDIKVPGIDKPHVVSAWDVLCDNAPDIGQNVVIVGGSATGCETAHYIASMGIPDPETFFFLMFHDAEEVEYAKNLLYNPGRKITIIDMVERLADNVGKSSRWGLLKSLRLLGVDMRPKTKLVSITDDEVLVESAGKSDSIPADTVIIAVGALSENSLSKEIKGGEASLITIGDAKEPRKITEAVREGFQEALKI